MQILQRKSFHCLKLSFFLIFKTLSDGLKNQYFVWEKLLEASCSVMATICTLIFHIFLIDLNIIRDLNLWKFYFLLFFIIAKILSFLLKITQKLSDSLFLSRPSRKVELSKFNLILSVEYCFLSHSFLQH